jgi:hypothetical protein
MRVCWAPVNAPFAHAGLADDEDGERHLCRACRLLIEAHEDRISYDGTG